MKESMDKVKGGMASLASDMMQLMLDTDSTDGTFLVGNDEVHFHTLILRTRCKSFQSMTIRSVVCNIPGASMQKGSSRMCIRWDKPSITLLRDVLTYIYTGDITLTDATVFAIMDICTDLGLDHLTNLCQSYVLTNLTTQNACTFLTPALKMTGSDFGDKVMQFIWENPLDVFKCDAFMDLDQDVLVRIIGSDSLSLPEEEVWRAVLSWGKKRAGVSGCDMHLWSEEERGRVRDTLDPVINHVRLLLIDSKVFADEVEPSGCVPMETSLERYRYAALPETFQSDKKVQPRLFLKLFEGSLILSGDRLPLQKTLNSLYGDHKQNWRLVYRASRDGFDGTDFHRSCDEYQATMTIILTADNYICCGFTDVSWGGIPSVLRYNKGTSNNRYHKSDNSFLVSLFNPNYKHPVRIPITRTSLAIHTNPSFGPIFGGGADLSIASHCNLNSDSYSNLPHSYGTQATPSNILCGSYRFKVIDYEVFTPV